MQRDYRMRARFPDQQLEESTTRLPTSPPLTSPRHSLRFGKRRRPATLPLRMAMAIAFYRPTGTPSRLPPVSPV